LKKEFKKKNKFSQQQINKMKTIFIKLLALIIFVFIQNYSKAGIDVTIRKTCSIQNKYKVRVAIWEQTSSGSVLVCSQSNSGCTYALAACNGFIPLARADRRIGSNKHSYHYYSYPYYAGNSFVYPSVVTSSIVGIGIGDIEEEINFNSTANNTEVTINGFSGRLAASINSQYGSAYRVVIWKGINGSDSIMNPSKVLLEGSVRIENGTVITTGFFSPSDFTVTTVLDASGFMVNKVEPIVGLQKVLQLPYDDADNSIAVHVANHGGFGDYDPNAIFDDDVAIPTLTEWGLILLAIVLLTIGVIILKRQNNLSSKLYA
jgi:hypothetical protein